VKNGRRVCEYLSVNVGAGTVIITIVELNENPPRFILPWTPDLPFYTLTISERQRPGTYVTTMECQRHPHFVRFFLQNDTDEFDIATDTGQLISLSLIIIIIIIIILLLLLLLGRLF